MFRGAGFGPLSMLAQSCDGGTFVGLSLGPLGAARSCGAPRRCCAKLRFKRCGTAGHARAP